MSQSSVESLLGRLLTDPGIRSEITASPELVCRREGYDLTEPELRLISQLNISTFVPLATSLEPRLCRAGTLPKQPRNRRTGVR